MCFLKTQCRERRNVRSHHLEPSRLCAQPSLLDLRVDVSVVPGGLLYKVRRFLNQLESEHFPRRLAPSAVLSEMNEPVAR